MPADLFPGAEIVTPFHSPQGEILGYEVRWPGKKIYPYKPDGSKGGFWDALPGGLRPLYDVPGILANPDRKIMVCEGPKAFLAAGRFFPDVLATGWPGGISCRGQVDFEPLKRRTVIWWPDNDGQGLEGMNDIYLQWAPVHTPWFVLPPEDAPKGWDAADLQTENPTEWLRARLKKHEEWYPRVEPIIRAYQEEMEAKRAAAAAKRASSKSQRRDSGPKVQVTDDPSLPEIRIAGGALPRMVDEAEEALLKSPHAETLFQRAGLMMELSRLPLASSLNGVRRTAGAPVLSVVTPPRLVELFTRAARWVKYDSRMEDWKPVDCPRDVASVYLARHEWRLRPLSGLAEAPTLRHDGSILAREGYDPATALYLSFGGVEFPAIPESPTREEGRAALAEIESIFENFPFTSRPSCAVAAAAVLTGLVRRSLLSSPLICISATAPGTGKSLLTDLISIIVTGRTAPAMSQGESEEENRKRLLASLMSGDMILNVDNVSRPLEGDAFCSVLTQDVFRDRILGASEMRSLPTDVLMLANGNNMMIRGDLSSRCLLLTLDAKCEHPEEREFEGEIRSETLARRGALVAAALTALRAYHAASRPKVPCKPWGRFEGWSSWVRSALIWLGEADPCATTSVLAEADPVRQGLGGLLEVLGERYLSEFTVRQVLMDAGSDPDLMAAVSEVAADRSGKPSPRLLGWALKKHAKRVVGGRWIEACGSRASMTLWKLMPERTVTSNINDDGLA